MTFKKWLKTQRHDPVGDFALDACEPTPTGMEPWPRGRASIARLHEYLHTYTGSDAAHAALDRAWVEWQKTL